MKFVLATFNRDKAAELQALLALPGAEIVPLADWPGASAPEETGETLIENARIKARAALALTGLPAIADDTGLEVDALGGHWAELGERLAVARKSRGLGELVSQQVDLFPETRARLVLDHRERRALLHGWLTDLRNGPRQAA